jgi:acetylornithine/N-succinyldiaminopimelate aminotransferase
MTYPSLMNTYNRLSVSFESGEGAWLFDTDGNRYLDALSGIAVCGLGHSHPAVTRAITEQAGKLMHTSNIYRIPLQEELGDRLCDISGMDKVFFANSGAEANEAAIKLARKFGHSKGIDTPTIIVMDGAFHGRTLATLTATGNRSAQAGFEPLVSGFIRAPYDDIDAIKAIAANNKNVVAILVEPIQGEAGVRIPAKEYLGDLREICDENDWLLMLDEVQTGNGRTGRYFAYQHTHIVPDVVTTAKGLGNGFPLVADTLFALLNFTLLFLLFLLLFAALMECFELLLGVLGFFSRDFTRRLASQIHTIGTFNHGAEVVRRANVRSQCALDLVFSDFFIRQQIILNTDF